MENNNANSVASLAAFIWKNADDLWGDFKHTDFGKIILPFTLLRRLECVLEDTREQVLEQYNELKDTDLSLSTILTQITQHPFYNTSNYTLATLGATKTRANIEDYISQFSPNARVIFEQFDFVNTIARMDKANVLYKICQNFASIDLHPEVVPERVMSNLYEHLIRRFGAEVNEGAEDFMTPRDVVHLATSLVLDPDNELVESQPGIIRTLYDPTCGTGGFLSDAMEYVASFADQSKVPPTIIPYGQELEPETHAVCLTGMLLRTLESSPTRDLSQNIKLGSTLSNDQFFGSRFHYGLANPPFGKKWEKDAKEVNDEHENLGFSGRFGPGLPRISDGSMLFLLHLASKLELPQNGGGRAAIVLSGSPLFNGGAGSGESEIRRWLLEQDLVEAIVALPTELFFRTGIATYLWVLSNKKPADRKHKVQLINAGDLWTSIKNEGNKRRIVSPEQQRQILNEYVAFENTEISRVYDHTQFGYRRIRVLRPLRQVIKITAEGIEAIKEEKYYQKLKDDGKASWDSLFIDELGSTHPYDWLEAFVTKAVKDNPALGKANKSVINALIKIFGVRDETVEPITDKKGNVLEDKELTDYENVPLSESVEEYFAREVTPHVPDAWIDESYRDAKDEGIGVVGYEINFNRYFYKYEEPPKLEDIDRELKRVEAEIAELLAEVADEY